MSQIEDANFVWKKLEVAKKFAEKKRQWVNQWKQVLLSGESHFSLHQADGRLQKYPQPSTGFKTITNYILTVGNKRRYTWGRLQQHFRTNLVSVEANLNAQKYIEILHSEVVTFMEEYHPDVWILQHDNAAPHTVCDKLLENNQIRTLSWPHLSPDLSLKDHVWDQIKRKEKISTRTKKRIDFKHVL